MPTLSIKKEGKIYMKNKELQDYLREVLEHLEQEDGERELEVECNTYWIKSDYFIQFGNEGFVDLENPFQAIKEIKYSVALENGDGYEQFDTKEGAIIFATNRAKVVPNEQYAWQVTEETYLDGELDNEEVIWDSDVDK